MFADCQDMSGIFAQKFIPTLFGRYSGDLQPIRNTLPSPPLLLSNFAEKKTAEPSSTVSSNCYLLLFTGFNSGDLEGYGLCVVGAAGESNTVFCIPGMTAAEFNNADHGPNGVERSSAEILGAAFEIESEYLAFGEAAAGFAAGFSSYLNNFNGNLSGGILLYARSNSHDNSLLEC